MSRVLRYSIPVDGQAHYFTLNAGATIDHVASRQPDVVDIWVVQRPGRAYVEREFTVVGTGHQYPDHWVWVGTALAADGALVWHVMEVPS